MEQYVVVLEELEKKVKTNEQEKLQALRERDNALMEMRTIRERYKSVIVGAERFTHDFEWSKHRASAAAGPLNPRDAHDGLASEVLFINVDLSN